MRKNFNKLATLALSGMMVMSMAMPAFANPANYEKAGVWKKVLYTDLITPAPNTAFKFKITPATETEVTVGTTKYQLNIAPATAVKIQDAEFNPAIDKFGAVIADKDGTPAQGRQFTKEVEIQVKEEDLGTKYGYFLFNMEEEKTGYQGINYSYAKYKVLVYREQGKEPKAFVQRADNATGNWMVNAKVDTIYNNYGMHVPPVNPDPNPNPGPNPDPNPNPNDTTHDVLIKKVRKGNISDNKNTFKLKIYVEPDNQPAGKTESFSYRVGPVDTTQQYTIFEGGQTNAITVDLTAGGDGVHIGGLTVGDKVHVEELDGTSYTMGVGSNNTNSATYIQNLDETAASLAAYKTSFNSIKDGSEVTVTNTKNGVAPTGIIMNVAPYAMMLAVAGGLGVVFVNRKKEEE
jgi:hypothetical protein